ncbi:hypothetical protein CULT_1750009 [[Clostridium] ultunense Esp]|uniref:Uncharacterized protein n=1 Tax=[Clostridium] ultunense Esp TaxID=1288971 RepID=M1YUM9_9FIRM|nr:hypothetical protein [Schnuerera ultunensis]CCQ94230.1 hypothetical protein CULT_1750009 [[Clostridium] ultunense Esp]SHD76865.1 conserved protein of unknown function [[Clostridium] ultunense Esp]
MKNTLRSQLETYKRDNTESSKEAMLSTMDSIFNSMTDYDISALSSIETAKKALTSRETNKNEIIQTVESVISSLS